ncbi:antibiotic biosynthesis monooxygenase family protein [Salinispora oceanensis]|uniref:antibiotic biosynthesis monooxygenase family protein n=1 Tax=Salinispora oceanensis TaxID=1050199 RepID=UPI00053411D0
MTDPHRARVLLFCRAVGTGEALTAAYHTISDALAGTPGLLHNELLRDSTDPTNFIVLSEWESIGAFHSWESGTGHRDTTAPLRPYQDHSRGRPFGLYEVVGSY